MAEGVPVGFNLEEARRRAVECKRNSKEQYDLRLHGVDLERAGRRAAECKKNSNYKTREKLLKENDDLRAKIASMEKLILDLFQKTVVANRASSDGIVVVEAPAARADFSTLSAESAGSFEIVQR